MLPSHRERLFQIQQESGLDFIQSLHESDYAPPQYNPPHMAVTPAAVSRSTDTYHTPAQSRTGNYSSGISNVLVAPEFGNHIAVGQNLGLDGIDSILDRHGLLQPGDMIDFYGPSCCGKTLYLYAIIISTILPRTWRYSKSKPAVLLNGKARSVIFFDMEQGFSADRLKTLLSLEIVARLGLYEENETAKVQKQSNNEAEGKQVHDKDGTLGTVDNGEEVVDEAKGKLHQQPHLQWQESYRIDTQSSEIQAKIEQLVLSCLGNVHVFRPQDAISAIVALRTLDQYLTSNTAVPSSSSSNNSPPFAILMIDSLSSFYWQERASNNHTRFTTVLIDSLNRLVPRWKLIFISTTWSLPSKTLTTDQTVTDSLRARFRYRFLMQPKTLDRFDSEDDLVREWARRQGMRRRQKQREHGLSSAGREDVTSNGDDGDGDEYAGSVFQAQMLIPSVENARQELFRFSISDAAGVCSFSVPVQQ